MDGKGWTLKNGGTGKYLKDATAAKYDEPTYFSFCTLTDVTTGIREISDSPRPHSQVGDAVYSLQGVKMGAKSDWNSLPQGLYIVDGKVILKK